MSSSPPPQQSSSQAVPAQTPERHAHRQPSASGSTIQSAPPGKRTMHFVGSPAAQQRSRETLEIVQVTRTLKEGLMRLKAMVDPTTILLSPTRRPMRALRAHSANSPLVSPTGHRYRQLSRHSSMVPQTAAGREGVFSCPQRLERRAESNVARAPRFELSGINEDERAAETMILIMNSEHSSQQASPVSPPEPRPRAVEQDSTEEESDDLSLLVAGNKRQRKSSPQESTEELAKELTEELTEERTEDASEPSSPRDK
ncbi:hypothetical protein DL89DRAFT_292432 [Linderina pennispora]|uniref:Uncharacterized protein n=1 Tax=Linderina pennispora TaxID=61395 RepID=A0A1Y1WBC2_9FUNG|nr:uncharacterized protein DL89DRAFT_292432 [Linderina pennispora]ORX70839.1 hypothetical protein DL89DRAFT_292432 [Linderina pennispora]